MVSEMGMIGKMRLPNEACGILLPYAVGGRQVLEVPNRATMPHDSFTMMGEDIALTLEMLFEHTPMSDRDVEKLLGELVYWHTHPRGNVGPSKGDLQNKLPGSRNIVVAIHDDEALATWF